jgi:hypothetical protein
MGEESKRMRFFMRMEILFDCMFPLYKKLTTNVGIIFGVPVCQHRRKIK